EAGVLIAPNATIADPELDKLNGGDGDWSGASIEIARKSSGHRGRGGKDDDFGFAGNDDLYLSHGKVYKVVEDGDDQVIGTWSESSRGKLTITFKTSNGDDAMIPTNEDVNNILRQVTYQNESDNPKESVILTVTVKDGNAKWNGEQGKGGEGRV